jgi:membrane protease YdiL (CAAX protease family)
VNDSKKPGQSSDSALIRFWYRIPIVIRAILVGFIVFALAGSVVWTMTMMLIPAPWSLVVMAGVLWVHVKYFSGSWGPKSTAPSRKACFRTTRMPARLWFWSISAALLAVVVIQSGIVATFRFIPFPDETWNLGIDFSAIPLWMAWLFIIMASLVAGITEEVGFRGYMQVPLEKRYSPVEAIILVSLVFVAAHLNQAWAPQVLVHLFLISVMWGVLAYAAGSIIPCIISHVITDIFNFAYWWTDVGGRFDKRPISETGIDTHFIVWILILVVSVALFCVSTRKTLLIRRRLNV